MVKKTIEQKETINNLKKFYLSREEVINFFRDYIEIISDANYDSKHSETKWINYSGYYIYELRKQ